MLYNKCRSVYKNIIITDDKAKRCDFESVTHELSAAKDDANVRFIHVYSRVTVAGKLFIISHTALCVKTITRVSIMYVTDNDINKFLILTKMEQ